MRLRLRQREGGAVVWRGGVDRVAARVGRGEVLEKAIGMVEGGGTCLHGARLSDCLGQDCRSVPLSAANFQHAVARPDAPVIYKCDAMFCLCYLNFRGRRWRD